MDHDATALAARAARAQDPAEGLRAVARLREMIDQLEARQVDRALQRGWSWAQVARPLGISKQAAHRRHAKRPPAPPSEELPDEARDDARVVITGEARAVVVRARQEAARLGEGEVEPVHLLAGLAQAPAGPAQDALLHLGINLDRLRGELAKRDSGRRSTRSARRPEISPRTRRVFECALGESQRRCDGHLGPEHLLLALLRDGASPAVELLIRLGPTADDVETAVCHVLRHTDFARSL